MGDTAGKVEPALHTARKLPCPFIRNIYQSHKFQCFLHFCVEFLAAKTVKRAEKTYIFLCGQVWIYRKILRNIADIFAPFLYPDTVFKDYLSRIMDNIASNIEKYADRTQDVDISISCRTVSEGAYAGIAVENTVLAAASHEDSTGIGTRSMANMMHAMKGKFETEEADGMYRVKILFPVMAVRSDETA